MYAAARYANAQKGPGWASLVLLTSFWCRFGRWEWCQTESEVVSWPNLVHQWTPPPPLLLILLHYKALDSTAAQLLSIYICIGLNCIASEAFCNSGNASLSEFATRLAEINRELRNIDIKSLVGHGHWWQWQLQWQWCLGWRKRGCDGRLSSVGRPMDINLWPGA